MGTAIAIDYGGLDVFSFNSLRFNFNCLKLSLFNSSMIS